MNVKIFVHCQKVRLKNDKCRCDQWDFYLRRGFNAKAGHRKISETSQFSCCCVQDFKNLIFTLFIFSCTYIPLFLLKLSLTLLLPFPFLSSLLFMLSFFLLSSRLSIIFFFSSLQSIVFYSPLSLFSSSWIAAIF